MRRSLTFLFALVAALSLFMPPFLARTSGQARTPSASKKQAPKKSTPIVTRCGVHWQSVDEFLDMMEIEWRVAAASDNATFYYNTRKMLCNDKGILRVWIKKKNNGETHDDSMSRDEFNCRTNQMRIVSITKYNKDGSVIDSWVNDKTTWSEVLPDSIGEAMLENVCRKRI